MAQSHQSSQQSRIQSSSPKRQPHIPDRRKTPHHGSTPRNNQERNTPLDSAASRYNQRGIPGIIEEMMAKEIRKHLGIQAVALPKNNIWKNRER
jgi:hypothetical protein